MTDKGVVRRSVVRVRGGERAAADHDQVVVEEPLEIRVDGDALAVTMRTPGEDAVLALGFLFAEGVIASVDDVGQVAHCGRPGEDGYGNVIEVRAAAGARLAIERLEAARRGTLTTATCGVCGRRQIDDLLGRMGPLPERRVPLALLASGPERLAEAQRRFARTGGLHAACALDRDGAVLASAEDVGRHNAVDKVVGTLLKAGRVGRGAAAAAGPAVLVVSGRASFEMVQKAHAAGVGALASVSAPSSLAVDLAAATGMVLAGFVRGGTLNLYTHAYRVDG